MLRRAERRHADRDEVADVAGAEAGARPQHGYGILRDVEEIADGRVTLQAGTLYAALDRLSSDGWVDVDREEVVDGRLRRYYRLTEPGAGRLAAEVEKLQAHTRAARQRLRARLSGGTA